MKFHNPHSLVELSAFVRVGKLMITLVDKNSVSIQYDLHLHPHVGAVAVISDGDWGDERLILAVLACGILRKTTKSRQLFEEKVHPRENPGYAYALGYDINVHVV